MNRFNATLFILTITALLIPNIAAATIISADPTNVGFDGQQVELGSSHNVVVHIPLVADAAGDTLESITTLNYFHSDLADNTDIAAAHLWYVADDSLGKLNTTTANYLGLMSYTPRLGIDPGWSLSTLSQVVSNNGALYVTVDIAPTAVIGREIGFTVSASKIEFQSNNDRPLAELPISPPLITISTFFPASPLDVNYTKTGQVNLSTNQAFTPLTLTIDNVGSTAVATAPIFLQGITVTVKDQTSTMIAPDLALQKIGVFGLGPNGPIYGEVTAIPSSAVPIYIPFSTTITVANDISLDVFATTTSNTATAIASFSLEIEQGQSFAALDAISLRAVTTQAASPDTFPFQSNLFTLRYAASHVDVYHTSILTNNDSVLKGQTDVSHMGITFINPGVTNTAQADISKIIVTVTDGSNNPIVPNAIFSRIALAGQSVTYGELTSLPTSGNQMVISLSSSFVSIPIYQPITATVVVDILPTATATEFKLTLSNASAITAQDGNSQLIIPALAAYGSDPFPMNTDVIPIATSFNIAGLSIAPATVYPNSRSRVLELTFNHPGPSSIGDLLLHGLTITAKDQNDQLIAVNQDLESTYITDAGNQILGLVTPTTSSTLYIHFSLPLVMAPFATAVLHLEQVALGNFNHQLFKLSIESNLDISVTQPSDPTRSVFVAGLWPIESTVMSLGGGDGELFLTNYPNPFAAGYQDTNIAFYIAQSSTVTIKIFTLLGDQVQLVLNNEYRSAGGHNITWNGRTATGGVVKNGVYLVRVEALPVVSGDKIIQIRKIAVVK